MENTSVEIIKPDAVISVSISAGFYKRLQNLTIYHSTQKPAEEMEQIIEDLKQDKVEDEWTEHFETLLILSNEIEEQARIQGFVETAEIPSSEL
jgi:hypothetical protein